MTTPPQYSPDGQWWWDGTRWVPAAQAPPPAQAPQPAAQAPMTPAYGQQPFPAYLPKAPEKTDGKAIGSVIASVLWVCGLGSVVGVVLAHLSRGQARRQGRAPASLATAGLVLGYLGIAATVAVTATVLVLRDPLVSSVKNDAELQTAADAQRAFHDASGRYATSVEELRPYGYRDFDGKVDVTVLRASATSYCMTSRILGQSLYVSDARPMPSNHSCR